MTRALVGLRIAAAALIATGAVLTVPALTAPASAAVPGLYATYQYTTYTSANKGLRVDCPSGKRLIGTAASIGGGEGQVRWDQITPYSDHLYVHASEDGDGYTYTWSLSATVICADPPPGYEIVSNTSTTTSDQYNSVAADCTGDNQLLGMGFGINGGPGQVGIDDFKATGPTRATGWAYEDGNGYSGTWSLTMYAICADPLPGYEIVQVQGGSQSATSSTLSASCSSGNKLVGGGGQVDGGEGQVILEDFSQAPTSYSVKAYEDQDGTTASWHLHAYAICAAP